VIAMLACTIVTSHGAPSKSLAKVSNRQMLLAESANDLTSGAVHLSV
jgi:hypothetical protein